MKYLIFCLVLLVNLSVKADHMGGGEMYYFHLGNNNYRITLVKFFQCSESSQKTEAKFGVYHNSTFVTEVTAPLISETTYEDEVHSSCVTSNDSQCMRRSVFTTEVQLPPNSGNYYVTYQRCCLSYAIDNILSPNTFGLTAYCKIPGSFVNSSPVFNHNPPPITCRNMEKEFDLSAADPDGDQLTYELFTPLNGGSTSITVPSPALPPPFSPVTWENGYDEIHQLGLSSAVSIDESTGILTVNPNNIGNYYLGVRVKEYRNSVLIGEINRSFILKTVSCTQILSVSINHLDSTCFTNNSFDFDAYVSNPFASANWDFGSNASIDSTSNYDVFNVTFDTTGTFPLTFTASYNGCVRTIHSTVTVLPDATIDFTIDPELKCAPYSAQFINLSQPYGPVSYQWTFDDGSFSSEVNPQFTYNYPGSYNVGLVMTTQGICPDTLALQLVDYIVIYPSPQAGFDFESSEIQNCEHDVQFTNLSSGADSIFYHFNDGAFSTESNPLHTYTGFGLFLPSQIVVNEFGCQDTAYAKMVLEQPEVYIPNSFTANDDEHNRYFTPVTVNEVHEWDLRIYNRWRDLVFLSYDPAIGWDGTYKGRLAPVDTYTYILEFIGCDGEKRTIKGHVNLLR